MTEKCRWCGSMGHPGFRRDDSPVVYTWHRYLGLRNYLGLVYNNRTSYVDAEELKIKRETKRHPRRDALGLYA